MKIFKSDFLKKDILVNHALIKVYKNIPYKLNMHFERLCKIDSEKWKKPTFLYPGLRYAHKKNLLFACYFFNVCLSTKIVLLLEKNLFVWRKSFDFAIKIMLVKEILYMEVV